MPRNHEVTLSKKKSLNLEKFKEMDYYAVNHYDLPIELMMENAGLQLARLIMQSTVDKKDNIVIGIGNGNNGGGGLVASRRLAAWGYNVSLDIYTDITKNLPKKQLVRAIKFGVKHNSISSPDIWVDAYLGFSQRLPLPTSLMERILKVNSLGCKKISLDIPTGFLGDPGSIYFKADEVMSLAAAKKILFSLPNETHIYIADIGIPLAVYKKFDLAPLPFYNEGLLKINRVNG